MNAFVKRGLVVAAIGALALGTSACGAVSDAIDEADDCTDLEMKVDEFSPDKSTALPDTPPEDYTKLLDWMSKNGKKFNDKDLGQAVTDYGDYAPGYYAEELGTDVELSDEEWAAFEKANEDIDKKCEGLGFGFEEE